MRTSIIVSFLGEDRPGLVEEISGLVSSHEGNWLESRMSKLAGKFAGIIQIGVEREQVSGLVEALQGLSSQGISLLIEESDQSSDAAPTRMLELGILGLDRPGIVHEVSQALAEQSINVAEMSTNITTAAMTGELLFNANASIEVPESADLDLLEEKLVTIGSQLAVDIDLVLDRD